MPELFKYASVFSVPFFALVALLLFRLADTYSPTKHTISQTIIYLKNPLAILVFRLNFVVKALLDYCFDLYLLSHFKVSYFSLTGTLLFLSALFFGSLAYFTEASHSRIHRQLVYTSGALWALGQLLLSRLVGNNWFLIFSIIILPIPVIVGLSLQFTKKVNAFMQTACVLLWYAWVLVILTQV